MLSLPTRMEGPPSGHSAMATSLSPHAARGAVAAQLLSSGPSSHPELAECWDTAAASLQRAASLSFHLLAPLGFGSLHVFTYSDGSSDLSPWKRSWSQGRAKPAALWSFSFKNSFYSPVNPFPLVPEETAAPEIS